LAGESFILHRLKLACCFAVFVRNDFVAFQGFAFVPTSPPRTAHPQASGVNAVTSVCSTFKVQQLRHFASRHHMHSFASVMDAYILHRSRASQLSFPEHLHAVSQLNTIVLPLFWNLDDGATRLTRGLAQYIQKSSNIYRCFHPGSKSATLCRFFATL
jgi:hypothetical protein